MHSFSDERWSPEVHAPFSSPSRHCSQKWQLDFIHWFSGPQKCALWLCSQMRYGLLKKLYRTKKFETDKVTHKSGVQNITGGELGKLGTHRGVIFEFLKAATNCIRWWFAGVWSTAMMNADITRSRPKIFEKSLALIQNEQARHGLSKTINNPTVMDSDNSSNNGTNIDDLESVIEMKWFEAHDGSGVVHSEQNAMW